MTPKQILVASSDANLRAELRVALESAGHWAAETEIPGAARFESFASCDLMILAAPFEGIKPHTLCREVRSRCNLAILVIGDNAGTAVIDALNAGADEYVAHPFAMAELSARVRALLRRAVRRERREIVLHDRAVDMDAHKITGPGGQVSHLTPKEHLVLQYLMEHLNTPRTHRELAQTIWQRDGDGELEYMRIVIQQLRRKLEPDPNKPRYILTERSVGYRFRLPMEIEPRSTLKM